jgi:hypothetical protein
MRCAHDPLYEIDHQTGATIEVFYANRTLETFGGCGAGWFWWLRRQGCSPGGLPTGPFVRATQRIAMRWLRECRSAAMHGAAFADPQR